MTVKMRQHVERMIARRLINDGLNAGYTISVNNGEDQTDPMDRLKLVLDEMFQTDEEHLVFHKDGKQVGWVYFVYGNGGWDVISDYTTNLEHIMRGAESLSDKFS